jgi:hypothetical protein
MATEMGELTNQQTYFLLSSHAFHNSIFMTLSQLLASSNYTPFFLEIKSFKPKYQATQGTLSHNSRRCNVCCLPNTKKHTWRFLTDFTSWLWSRQLKLSDILCSKVCSKDMVYDNSLWTDHLESDLKRMQYKNEIWWTFNLVWWKFLAKY